MSCSGQDGFSVAGLTHNPESDSDFLNYTVRHCVTAGLSQFLEELRFRTIDELVRTNREIRKILDGYNPLVTAIFLRSVSYRHNLKRLRLCYLLSR